MATKRRSSQNPKRRVVAQAALPPPQQLQALADQIRYVGSGHHKRRPGDYGLERTNPVPTKSLCDAVSVVPLANAQHWLRRGVLCGMISALGLDGLPKYIWSVAEDGRVFEAKTHPNTPGQYHGYPLEHEDDMRSYVLALWEERSCKTPGA